MPIFDKNNKPTPGKFNKSMFDKNSGLGSSRGDVKKGFMKMTDTTRSLGSHIMKIPEKRRLIDELLPKSKFGSYISAKEVDQKIGKLQKMKYPVRFDRYEASKLQDQIDFLKKLK